MKIVVSIRQRSFARFVAFDLAEAARRLGWVVHWIDFDALTQQLRGAPRETWQATLARVTDEVRAFEPDLVFSYGIEAILPPFPDALPDDPWRLADVARAPVACFFYDFGPPFDRPVDAATAPYIDRLQAADIRVFCWDRHALADLHRYGVAAEYLPMAVNDQMFFPPVAGTRRDAPVVFSGGPTPERCDVLRHLVPFGLSVYGYDRRGWTSDAALEESYKGFVPERDRLRHVYQRARLTVNVTRAHGRASLNMRVFEAMACGCLVVTDRADEAATLFTPGEHLVAIADDEPIVDLVSRLLDDEEGRERMAATGARVVRDAHTYVHRLASIADTLRAFVSETRAWPFWERFVEVDPARALRFVDTLRADRTLLRDDLWHAADATAAMRAGQWDRGCLSLAHAERCNPALRRLQPLRDAMQLRRQV
ncbi:MAG: glycosyltransferase [Acidobacteria bacterium]|nr:glycosyltransferase [Acidobacteriota bacterium]